MVDAKTNNDSKDRSAVVKIASSVIQSQVQAVKGEFAQTDSWEEFFFNSLALIACGAAVAAYLIEGGLIVTIVSGISAFLGPYAALQQQRLTDLQNMRVLQQKLRDEVNRFDHENDRLRKDNEKLAQSAKRLQNVESNLTELSKLQGHSVDTLMQQIQEYRKIQERIKESLEAKVIQNLIDVVIRSDRDEDFIIDKSEIDGLLRRLKTINGVNFSESNFRRALARTGYGSNEIDDIVLNQRGGFSLHAVMDVIKNLLDDSVPPEENIFSIAPQELLPKKLQFRHKK